MLSDTCHPAGVQETVGHRFLYTCRTAGAKCDLPKPRRGERCIRRTKLTPMVRFLTAPTGPVEIGITRLNS